MNTRRAVPAAFGLVFSLCPFGVLGCAEQPQAEPCPETTEPGGREQKPLAFKRPGEPKDAPDDEAPKLPRLKAEKEELEALNTWAQKEGVASSIAAFVSLGLPIDQDVKSTLSIQYNRREAPDSATATVLLEELMDDSLDGQRFTLRFSKSPCKTAEECQAGPPPWKLFELSMEQRCKPGRGHETYSSEPCQ